MVIHRSMLAVAESGGIVYAIGGYYGPEGDILLSAEKFIPNINDWERIADMPFPRENHGAVGYSGKAYVFGGQYHIIKSRPTTGCSIGYPDARRFCLYAESNTWSQRHPCPLRAQKWLCGTERRDLGDWRGGRSRPRAAEPEHGDQQ